MSSWVVLHDAGKWVVSNDCTDEFRFSNEMQARRLEVILNGYEDRLDSLYEQQAGEDI